MGLGLLLYKHLNTFAIIMFDLEPIKITNELAKVHIKSTFFIYQHSLLKCNFQFYETFMRAQNRYNPLLVFLIFLSPDVGGGGAIEMTLVHPCVRPSFRPFFHPSEISSYIFCRINLKFCRLFSYDMKMCMWFLIFVLAIFWCSHGLC